MKTKLIDLFLQSESYQESMEFFAESMPVKYPRRAKRVREAAERGAEGSTHFEIISDWRRWYVHWTDELEKEFVENAKKKNKDLIDAGVDFDYCFEETRRQIQEAFEVELDLLQAWHHNNGSLHDQVGHRQWWWRRRGA